ncbi:MAG TPA: methylmalonyl Co-A mutase-associated GTPase MeaB, partial [candidate division Zixibacteria bacterium]|nr:methylmalonyl Co-A mutase-associated GTPase MeaB [candidate division Zixibacteria bacterium]
MTVLERFRNGDVRALSRLVSFVEDQENGYRDLLGRLYASVGKSLRIGVTGPPGAGKSTLVNGLTHELLRENRRVGIIAVDPTSPFTGGALLGDRVRMNEFPADGRVYFRSMATRGATGGLAAATNNVAVVYDSFGFDVTLIETVGVGQVELDIINACDVVVVVMVPESGDAVQAMKAGVMEIADVFCVNKSDRPGAERIAHELRYALETRRQTEDAWKVPIVLTEGLSRKGVDQLLERINAFVAFMKARGRFEQHRRSQIADQIINVLRYRFQREFIDKIQSAEEFR